MAADNMRSIATFTIFSFLLLTIAMFLVFYRYDFYNTDTGTLIRVGFIVGDSSNGNKEDKVAEMKSHIQSPQTEDVLETVMSNPKKAPCNKDHSRQSSVRNSPFYEKFLAIMATRSHHPGETGGQKSPSGGAEITTQNPMNVDSIRRMISKLDKSSDSGIPVERKSDVAVTSIIHPTTIKASPFDREIIIAGKNPLASEHPKVNGDSSSSTKNPEIKSNEDNRHAVSYPAERLPSPVPAVSPPRSWPSLYLPDSGFADSSEISPFSLFSRIADILSSKEDESKRPPYDSQEMWPKFEDITDFFASPRKRLLQGYSSEEQDSKEDSDFYEDYVETKDFYETGFLHSVNSDDDFDIPLQF